MKHICESIFFTNSKAECERNWVVLEMWFCFKAYCHLLNNIIDGESTQIFARWTLRRDLGVAEFYLEGF